MKIYFSCSVTGGRADEPVYAAIVDDLLARGHAVLTAHLARPDVVEQEQFIGAREVYRRDVRWIQEADALIAEVSTPSHGVGYEIALALAARKPVLCLHRQGARVSKMITGNDEPTLVLGEYADAAGALQLVRHFLERVSART